MKLKLLVVFIISLLLSSCHPKGEYRYRVEEKYKNLGGEFMMIVSDINNYSTHSIRVGKYTYEHTNPGDTLIIRYE